MGYGGVYIYKILVLLIRCSLIQFVEPFCSSFAATRRYYLVLPPTNSTLRLWILLLSLSVYTPLPITPSDFDSERWLGYRPRPNHPPQQAFYTPSHTISYTALYLSNSITLRPFIIKVALHMPLQIILPSIRCRTALTLKAPLFLSPMSTPLCHTPIHHLTSRVPHLSLRRSRLNSLHIHTLRGHIILRIRRQRTLSRRGSRMGSTTTW
jgi:hypothetical protein